MSTNTSLSGMNQPSEDDIIAALARALDAPEPVVLSWLTSFARHFDAKGAAERMAARHGGRTS
jgi:hypothetical protein